MRLVLFDWALGGHHPIYVRPFAEALNSLMEISVAAPDATLTELGDLQAELIPLGRARPADVNQRMRTRTRHRVRREIELLAHPADRATIRLRTRRG